MYNPFVLWCEIHPPLRRMKPRLALTIQVLPTGKGWSRQRGNLSSRCDYSCWSLSFCNRWFPNRPLYIKPFVTNPRCPLYIRFLSENLSAHMSNETWSRYAYEIWIYIVCNAWLLREDCLEIFVYGKTQNLNRANFCRPQLAKEFKQWNCARQYQFPSCMNIQCLRYGKYDIYYTWFQISTKWRANEFLL
jgi:hypothetical protein